MVWGLYGGYLACLPYIRNNDFFYLVIKLFNLSWRSFNVQ